MQAIPRTVILVLTLILLIGLAPTIHSMPHHSLKVHLIDVGQGDSILLETPNGKTILLDGGPPKAGEKVVKYLKERRIYTIDLLIATHPDKDHIGGLPTVMKEIEIERIIDSGKLHTTSTFAKYVNQIRKNHIPMRIATENEKIKIDPALDITILNAYRKGKNNNQASLAFKVSYQEIDFLFMGDIEKKQEKKLVEKYDLEAEFIKVAHHGSKTSSTWELFEEVNPDVALLTYSKNNKYGHPVERVIENIWKADAQIYSTAVYGDVVIHTIGSDYFIIPEKSPLDGLTSSVAIGFA